MRKSALKIGMFPQKSEWLASLGPWDKNQLTEESRSCFMRGPDFTSDTLRVPSSSLQLEKNISKHLRVR